MARYITVYSIIESWRRVPLQVLKNGFHHSGIFPFNPSIPLSNSYANLNNNVVNNNNGILLSSDHNRLVLYNNINLIQINDTENIPAINYVTIYPGFRSALPTYGRILSYFPSLFIKTNGNTYTKIFS